MRQQPYRRVDLDASLPSTAELESATENRYEILGILGSGGMGTVFRARHRTLGSPVAIKVLPPGVARSTVRLARFRREAALAANLSHPHIVPVFEFAVRGDLAFLVMPLVAGVTLGEELERRGRLSYPEVEELLKHVGGALAFAHARQIVHRDIKPANILLEQDPRRWLITDFGIAHVAASPDDEITHSGELLGTPAYMAPEQLSGGSEVDGRADLYALAATAFEALTGARPDLQADPGTLTRVIQQRNPEIPAAVAATLTAPLALARAERPPSVEAWLAALTRSSKRRLIGLRTAIGGMAAVAALAVGGWWWSRAREPVAPDRPVVAVLPFETTGRSVLISLDSVLPQAFAWQLQMLPGIRVISPPVVRAAVLRRFGGESQPLDTLLDLARELGATLVVAGQAESHDQRLAIRIQVRDAATHQLAASADTAGVVDSLHSFVARLVVETFATRMAREVTGLPSPSLPRGLPAIAAYFQGDRDWRRGSYDEAIAQFDRVIRLDSTYAPAYFKRMLAVVQIAPTAPQIRSALAAATSYDDRLDPVSRRLLEGYQRAMVAGDVQYASREFEAIVAEHPDAVDAWFALAELKFHFGSLLGTPIAESKAAFQEVLLREPAFAAPVGHLITLALAEGDDQSAREYIARYLAIDSTSVIAQLVAAGDTLLFRPQNAPRVLASFPRRPTPFLENVAFLASEFGRSSVERAVGRSAIDVLWQRTTSQTDRVRAFRMKVAVLLGSGREAEARTLVREARRTGVPQDEIDRWTVLAAVAELPLLTPPDSQAAAASRLLDAKDDPATSAWLAARWFRRRDAGRSTTALRALERLSRTRQGTDSIVAPFEASLLDDVSASDLLAAGDTAGALASWTRATRRFNVELVPFELVGSLWPLRLAQARVAAQSGRHRETLDASATFLHISAFVDQAAWPEVLMLRSRSALATGDTTLATNTLGELVEILIQPDAEGAAVKRQAELMLQVVNPSKGR